ncbi:MAG: hypothetical protein H6822_28270 [Planctomycetaceae bacterium]|nr:hypothetical protein [Planctomycetales bacterium]MCB9926077.1 hypothetical protein [Planctomycetaceae bacterium]
MTQNDRRGLGEDRLALAIASGKSVRDAAKEANISESTAYRRLSEATFRVRVDELRRKMTTDTIRLLSATGNEAVNCLRDAMQSADSTIRIRGGAELLKYFWRLYEHNAKCNAGSITIDQAIALVDSVLQAITDEIEDESQVKRIGKRLEVLIADLTSI